MKMPSFRARMLSSAGAACVAAALTLGAIGGASAQSPRTGGYFWEGPYVGANLGYQWSVISNNPTRPNGFVGGVQAGYSWQNQQFVYGLEADLQVTDAENVFAPWKFSNPWF